MKHQIRIIGGQWRGRKLAVPAIQNVRPTPDRVRETVFNWLKDLLPGAICLDAFAGSGALGFESLSRGAAKVVMIDESPIVVSLLKKQQALLKADNLDIYCKKMPHALKPPMVFDIVFLDPPYQQAILLPCCFFLEEKGYLAKEAYIYLEAKTKLDETMLPPRWQVIKSKQTGQVAYHLAKRIV